MLRIDQMTIHLPDGFAHRAGAIGRKAGEALGRLEITERRTLSRLAVPAVRVSATATDDEIAAFIARAVANRLNTGGRS